MSPKAFCVDRLVNLVCSSSCTPRSSYRLETVLIVLASTLLIAPVFYQVACVCVLCVVCCVCVCVLPRWQASRQALSEEGVAARQALVKRQAAQTRATQLERHKLLVQQRELEHKLRVEGVPVDSLESSVGGADGSLDSHALRSP